MISCCHVSAPETVYIDGGVEMKEGFVGTDLQCVLDDRQRSEDRPSLIFPVEPGGTSRINLRLEDGRTLVVKVRPCPSGEFGWNSINMWVEG